MALVAVRKVQPYLGKHLSTVERWARDTLKWGRLSGKIAPGAGAKLVS